MELRFNKTGYELLTDYLTEKLQEEDIKLTISDFNRTVMIDDAKLDFSDNRKEEGIKQMTAKLITICEERGLSKNSPIGVWINYIVEGLTKDITNLICSKIEKLIDDKEMSIYYVQSFQENEKARKDGLINVEKVDEIFKRIKKNLKKIKVDTLIEANSYIK